MDEWRWAVARAHEGSHGRGKLCVWAAIWVNGVSLWSACLLFVLLTDILLAKGVSRVRKSVYLRFLVLVGEEEKRGEVLKRAGVDRREILPGRCANRVLTRQEGLGVATRRGSYFESRLQGMKTISSLIM